MKPVIQQEPTGCAIASTAAIAGVSYGKAKKAANKLGIFASDQALWSETHYIKNLLKQFGHKTSASKINFTYWDDLPSCALISLKWHLENDKAYWHWAVFVRNKNHAYVLDSSTKLKNNLRKDFRSHETKMVY